MKFNSFSKSHSKQFVDSLFVFVRKQHGHMSEKCITFLAMDHVYTSRYNNNKHYYKIDHFKYLPGTTIMVRHVGSIQ